MSTSRTLLVTIACALLHTSQAADLLVAPGGSGNVHPSINAAIAAANSGDRILIAPAVYPGHVTINKDLTLLSNSATQRYTISGNLVLSLPAGQAKLTVASMWLTGELMENMASTVSGAVRLVDCVVVGPVTISGQHQLTCYLYRDSLLNKVTVQHGVVVGCHLTGTNSTIGTIYDMAVSVDGGSLRMIGNVIGKGATGTSTRIYLDPRGTFEVSNNLFVNNTASYSGPYVLVENSAIAPTAVPSVFVNNTFVHAASGNPLFLHVQSTLANLALSVRNNFFVGSTQPVTSASTAVVIAYNIAGLNTAQVDMATGAPTPGSPAINAGDPDPSFTDLDLSRNDAGCYGGSYSRDNFDDPLNGAASVLLLDVPRRTQAAWTMQLRADGFDR